MVNFENNCFYSVSLQKNVSIKIFKNYKPAAAAKLLQSCLTLCDPIDSSPWGSPVPGILQARTLEWVAISFSNAIQTHERYLWAWKLCLTITLMQRNASVTRQFSSLKNTYGVLKVSTHYLVLNMHLDVM